MTDETSSVNNTNSLDDNPGVGVRNYSSYTSQMIDIERSRENYKKANSAKLEKIKEAVYKTVSTWSEEDKYRVISEHGDADLLKQNPHGDKLNSLCTETLIIHLPIEDLNQILNDTKVSERELANQVKAINKEKKREADRLAAIAKRNSTRTSFNAGTFNEFAGVMTSNDTNKTILKKIAKKDPTYKIPKYILMQFTRLRKELSNVIDECFNKLDLASIAAKMGMDIGNDESILKKSIINKTLLYVALVTGKSKDDNLGNAIMDPTPYNNLLKYTSYSYVTGEPGLDLTTWRTLRNEARIAKKRIEVISKMQKQRASRHSSAFAALSGGNKTAKDIARNDRGALANLSDEELITLAARYGIDPQKYSIGKLKLELYRAMAANNRALSALDNEAAKARSKGHFADQGVLDAISIRKDFTAGNKNAIASATGSGNIPTISFNANGVRIDNTISKAVPVYIVGSGQVVMGEGGPIETAAVKKIGTGPGQAFRPNALDTASNRRKLLSDSDRLALDNILALSDDNRDKFINEQLKYKTNSILLQYIASIKNSKSKKYTDYDKNIAYAWIFSVINHRTELQKYIETNLYNGKPPFKTSDVIPDRLTKAAGFWHKINPVTGVKEVIDAFKNFGNRLKTNKDIKNNGGVPTSIDQLPTTQQDFYYRELDAVRKNPDSYALALGKYYKMKDNFFAGKNGMGQLYMAPSYSNITTAVKAYFPNDSMENIKVRVYDVLVMLKAATEGQRLLVKYLESKNNSTLTMKEFKKNAGFLGINKFTTAFKQIRNPISKIFGGSDKSALTGVDNENADVAEKPTNNGTSTLSPSGIPLIKLSGKDKEGSMAVPVYIVNQQETGDVKSGIKKLFTVQDTKTRRKKGDNTSEPGKYNTSLVIPFKNISDVADKKTKDNLRLSTKTALTRVVFSSVIVNKELAETSKNTENIFKATESTNNKLETNNVLLQSLVQGLGTPAVLAGTLSGSLAFPGIATAYGIAAAKQKITQLADDTSKISNVLSDKSGGIYTKSNTGSTITKLASGGTASITGDAASANIFANGAKPELVQSTGNMKVTPLHPGGTSTKQNVRKMTLNERSSALATSIASHVIKISYKLPDGAQDVSNPGEAIKVYNVKPGISDEVDLGNGNSASLIALVASIYSQLTAMTAQDQTNGQLLSTIAANTTNTGASQQSSIQSNPFAGGFPTSLDDILSGE